MSLPLLGTKHFASTDPPGEHDSTSSCTKTASSEERITIFDTFDGLLYLDELLFPEHVASTASTLQVFDDGLLLDLNSLVASTVGHRGPPQGRGCFVLPRLDRYEHFINSVNLLFRDESFEDESQASVIFQLPKCISQYHNLPPNHSLTTASHQSHHTSNESSLIFGASRWSLGPTRSTVFPVPHDPLSSGRIAPRPRTLSTKTTASDFPSTSGIQAHYLRDVTTVRHCRCPPPPLPLVPCA